MATHKSAEKRARQTVKRNKRNTDTVGAVRTVERKLRTALAAGDKTAAATLLKEYAKKSSKAATKGTLHKKTASRKLGRLSVSVNGLK